jgi:predicted alpha/beta hydrolase family esterase
MGRSGENWGQWLHDELIKKSYNVVMPNLSNPDHPDRQQWLTEITGTMDPLGANTIIVAHSLGVTSGLDYLEKAAQPIKGLVCVSGFSDDYGLELNSYFLKEKAVNFDIVNKKVDKVFVFYGDNDPYVPQSLLQLLAENLHVKPKIIPSGGHLNSAAGFTNFSQLLEAVLAI